LACEIIYSKGKHKSEVGKTMGKTTYEIFINKGYFWNQLKVEKA